MIRKGSLVRFTGNSRVIKPGKLLSVHDAKGDRLVVWIVGTTGKWIKKTIDAADAEEVVE